VDGHADLAGRGVPRVPCVPLPGSTSVDVAIVGAGVSAALAADPLLQAGQSVLVLDRRGPVRGSTLASTALLQFDLDQPLTLLARKIGRERAVRAYWRSAIAGSHSAQGSPNLLEALSLGRSLGTHPPLSGCLRRARTCGR
jgi:choline dehydrogenase-like flavoprotein